MYRDLSGSIPFIKVYNQAAPEYRKLPKDILNLFIKSEHGEMVPYSAFMKMEKKQGPNEITRFNLYTSSSIKGVRHELQNEMGKTPPIAMGKANILLKK